VVCQSCGFPLAPQASYCQNCGILVLGVQTPEGIQLFFDRTPISFLRRFWALSLDILIFWLTLGIGWIIWALVLLPKAQTPAKQILGYVLVDRGTGKRPPLWRVALRQFLPVGLAVFAFFGPLYVLSYTHEASDNLAIPVGGTLFVALLLIVDALFVFGANRRRLFDYAFNTSVVYEGKQADAPF
jgi:uncharacterized RDD family membrane protein YckC